MRRISWAVFLSGFILFINVAVSSATIWEVRGKVGLTSFYAEMDDTKDPVQVLIRVDNQALIESIDIPYYFVQMTDGNKQRCRPVAADEIISDYLDELRGLLPKHQKDIDEMLLEIRADYPQEKIVKVYANLMEYMKNGRPITWRANVENFLLGKRSSNQGDITRSETLIQAIGELSENYFWPNQIPPGESKTGILFFKRPVKQPASLFIQVGESFLGLPFEVKKSQTIIVK